MKISAGIPGGFKAGPAAKALEDQGYDYAATAETGHDPFFPLAFAAEHTERINLTTGIAVAFARNPMILANVGHDLNSMSKGRFMLGLGTQIAAHITKRFSMPWSHPAGRMREMIRAMHAIWDTWYDGEKLDFRGEYYTHTLMTHYFTPTDIRVRPAEDRFGRRGAVDDQGRGRGRRRHALPRLHDAAVSAGGHHAADRGHAGGERARSEQVRNRGDDVHRRRRHRGRSPEGAQRACAARSRSTARRPPTKACSNCMAGTTCSRSSTACRRRASGTRWPSP